MTLSRNVAYSVMWDRIRVNHINPGWMDTPGEDVIQRRFHSGGKDWLEEAEAQKPFGRLIKPDELAATIAFLASDESGIDDRRRCRVRPVGEGCRASVDSATGRDPSMTRAADRQQESADAGVNRTVIPHIDDVGNSHSANVAMMELGTGSRQFRLVDRPRRLVPRDRRRTQPLRTRPWSSPDSHFGVGGLPLAPDLNHQPSLGLDR